MFSCLVMYVSMAMATDDACAGQACSSGGSGIAAPWAVSEDYPQGLEMLQLNAARAAQTPEEADPAESPIQTEATPKFKTQCAKRDRVFKVKNVTGAECQQACAVNEFCKFWSHATDMDTRNGECLGCKGDFEEMPGYTTMAVGDLLVTEEKVSCLNVGFIRKEPNTGPTCEEPNSYCGSPESANCKTDTDQSANHRRRGAITKFEGKRLCKCGNETGYSEAGNWCRNCLPYPLGSTDVAAVTQALPVEGKNVSALGLGENISQVWFVPKLFLRRPFQLCCDERKWDKGCPACCANKKEECHAKCPNDDQKACMADCAFQETMCSRLCSDQILFDNAISAGMKGLELQCEKKEEAEEEEGEDAEEEEDEEEDEEETSEEETDEEEEASEEDSEEEEASDEDSEEEEASEEDSEEEAKDEEEEQEKNEEKEKEEKEEEKKDAKEKENSA